MAKKVRFKTEVNEADGWISYQDKISGRKEIFPVADLPEAIQAKLAVRGLGWKLETGTASSDPAAKLDDRLELYKQLEQGVWAKPREGGAPTVGVHIEALAELKGASVAAVQKSWRKLTEEQRAEVLANPQVVEKMEEIELLKAEQEDELDLLDL